MQIIFDENGHQGNGDPANLIGWHKYNNRPFNY
jgi:hypothetical protein